MASADRLSSHRSSESVTPRNVSTSPRNAQNSDSSLRHGAESSLRHNTEPSHKDSAAQRSRDSGTFRLKDPSAKPLSLQNVSTNSASPATAAAASAGDRQTNGLANNMTSQGQRQKTKASLSSIENSYQNIKHKTPVNQVGRTSEPSASRAVASKQVSPLCVCVCVCVCAFVLPTI
jgi:hypothetical protein